MLPYLQQERFPRVCFLDIIVDYSQQDATKFIIVCVSARSLDFIEFVKRYFKLNFFLKLLDISYLVELGLKVI